MEDHMSRLSNLTVSLAQETVEELYKDIERNIQTSQPGLCPVDLAAAFIHLSHARSCGKCTPCRVGLGKLEDLIDAVLDGKATVEDLDEIEKMADTIYRSG